MDLPEFPYHPDPIRSGSVRPGSEVCACCGRARGAIYTGPVYVELDPEPALCPWCIADGSAHARFGAEFTDAESLPGGAPPGALEAVLTRTPGFACWQSVDWPACCGDLCAFLGPAGIEEVRRTYPAAEGQLMGLLVHEMGISGGAAVRLLNSLHRDRGPTACIFRCRGCASLLARVDSP